MDEMDDGCPHGIGAAWCSICKGKVELLASSYRKRGRPMPAWLLKKLGLMAPRDRGPVMASAVRAAFRPDERVYRRY